MVAHSLILVTTSLRLTNVTLQLGIGDIDT